jgi:succinoglycan biosynthesis transport protein ExoP
MKDEFIKIDNFTSPAPETNLSELGYTLRKRAVPTVAVATTVFAGVAVATFSTTPQYRSETLILLDNQTSVPVVSNLMDSEANLGKDLSTEIQILQSQALVTKAISAIEPAYHDLSVSEVVRNLSIRQAGQADVLIVAYTDSNPERAKAVLEALGQTYVDYSLDRQRSQATNAIKFIEEQLPSTQQELNQVEETIRTFRESYGIVDPDSYATQVVANKQTLQSQTQELEAVISKTQQQYQELQRQMVEAGQNPKIALASSILSQDSVYQQLAGQLKEIEAKYTLERTRFYDNHPTIQNLKQQRDSMLQLLQYRSARVLGNAASQVDMSDVVGYGSTQQNLAAQLVQVRAELTAQISQLNRIRQTEAMVAQQFEQIPQLQQTYTELQREFKVKSEAVNNFLAKLQELRISEAQETAPWKILEPPYQPQIPISPNIQRNLLLGLIAGGLLGVGAAVLLEKSDTRLKRVEQVKELCKLPCLGMIPKVTVPVLITHYGDHSDFQGYQHSPFTEAIRSLALNLRYLGAEGEVKTLAVTSSTPSEGKSTLTYNMARVLAELGHRVLLVDADMRKPTLHQFLKRPNMFGLSTIIATETPWSQLVYSIEQGRLDTITSGPTPPNPVALLESRKMSELLAQWRMAYDYVLIDTPPVLGVTDAQSLASKVDGVMMVAALERATRASVTQTLEMLSHSRCKLVGMVINFANQGLEGNYSAYYHSYHATPAFNRKGDTDAEFEPARNLSTPEIIGNLWRRR